MADPTIYTVSYSFGGFQANSPTTPLPAQKVDNELANIAAAVATLVAAIKDIRRSDGALNSGSVTFDSLSSALKLTVDPTNGQQVAAAVAGAQASATAASGSATAASTSATNSANSAAAAAASAGTVNLALYLPKAGNLAGIGNPDTARANIQAPKVDGSDLTGRLATLTGAGVTDWNTVVTNGWYCAAGGAANAPDASTGWIAQVIALDAFYVTQIAYGHSLAGTSTSAVQVFRRHSYNNAGVRTWQPWESASSIPVGSTIWVNAVNAPPGFLKEAGQLVSRATYPALYAFAAASGNIVSEASWTGGNSGGFSTGDLATTFRLPDTRGEFIRGYDDGRGVDAARVIGARQADSLKNHTHTYDQWSIGLQAGNTAGYWGMSTNTTTPTQTGSPSTGAAAETRPRNVAKLACIKF